MLQTRDWSGKMRRPTVMLQDRTASPSQYSVRKITTLLGFALGLAWSLALADAADAQRRAAELLREGDLKGALREFDRVVTLEPGSSLAWYNRGLVRRQLGDCPAAITDFDRA